MDERTPSCTQYHKNGSTDFDQEDQTDILVHSSKNKPLPISQEYVELVTKKGRKIFPILLMGRMSSGKSTFLVAIDQLIQEQIVLGRIDEALYLDPDQYSQNWVADHRFKLKAQCQSLKGTDVEFQRPIILKIRYSFEEVILILFDVAGELSKSTRADEFVRLYPMFRKIPSVFFLIDSCLLYPAAIPSVYQQSSITKFGEERDIPPNNQGADIQSDADWTLKSIMNYLISVLRQQGVQPKQKNIAVCLTEADLLWGLSDEGKRSLISELEQIFSEEPKQLKVPNWERRPYEIQFDFNSWTSVGIEKRSDMIAGGVRKKWPLFCNVLSSEFGAQLFVLCSSYGLQPQYMLVPQKTDSPKMVVEVNPRSTEPCGVLDPILWLLSRR